LETVQKLPDVVSLMNAMGVLAEIERISGNYEQSDNLFRKYIALRDSTLGGQVKREVMSIEMKNNLEKQEYETLLLKQKVELQVKQKTILLISFVFVLLFVLMGFLIIRTSYIALKKSNAMKELEKQRMEEQIEKDRKISELEKMKFDMELKSKNKELVGYSLKIVTKNDLLNQISKQANKYYDNQALNKDYFNELSKIISDNLSLDKEWNEFKTLFEKVHLGFFDLLKQNCPTLTEHELRFCAYIKISLRPKEIARVLNISPDSVKTFKSRLKKKIGIGSEVSIDDYIRDI
jgi:DNA-binding CsgD family transcriptional regulator